MTPSETLARQRTELDWAFSERLRGRSKGWRKRITSASFSARDFRALLVSLAHSGEATAVQFIMMLMREHNTHA